MPGGAPFRFSDTHGLPRPSNPSTQAPTCRAGAARPRGRGHRGSVHPRGPRASRRGGARGLPPPFSSRPSTRRRLHRGATPRLPPGQPSRIDPRYLWSPRRSPFERSRVGAIRSRVSARIRPFYRRNQCFRWPFRVQQPELRALWARYAGVCTSSDDRSAAGRAIGDESSSGRTRDDEASAPGASRPGRGGWPSETAASRVPAVSGPLTAPPRRSRTRHMRSGRLTQRHERVDVDGHVVVAGACKPSQSIHPPPIYRFRAHALRSVVRTIIRSVQFFAERLCQQWNVPLFTTRSPTLSAISWT